MKNYWTDCWCLLLHSTTSTIKPALPGSFLCLGSDSLLLYCEVSSPSSIALLQPLIPSFLTHLPAPAISWLFTFPLLPFLCLRAQYPPCLYSLQLPLALAMLWPWVPLGAYTAFMAIGYRRVTGHVSFCSSCFQGIIHVGAQYWRRCRIWYRGLLQVSLW